MKNLPEWYLQDKKFISAGLLVVGIFTSSSFLETGNNCFHRMLGGMKWNLQIDKQLQFFTCTNSAWCIKKVLEQITCQWLWLEAMSLKLATCNKKKCKHVQSLHFYISSQFNEEAVSGKRRRIPKFKLCHGMEHHAREIVISDVCTVSIIINLWT